MNKLSEKEIEAIRNRAEKATEGPWDFVPYAEGNELAVITQDLEEIISEEVFEWEDATFIAHAREDIPKLLAEIDRLKKATKSGLDALYDFSKSSEYRGDDEVVMNIDVYRRILKIMMEAIANEHK